MHPCLPPRVKVFIYILVVGFDFFFLAMSPFQVKNVRSGTVTEPKRNLQWFESLGISFRRLSVSSGDVFISSQCF